MWRLRIEQCVAVFTAASRITLDVLDWLVALVERLIVLGVAFVVFFIVYQIIHGTIAVAEQKSLVGIEQNWKVIVLLLIPIFYRAVRKFLEEAEEAWGIKRKKELRGEASIEENPPAKKN